MIHFEAGDREQLRQQFRAWFSTMPAEDIDLIAGTLSRRLYDLNSPDFMRQAATELAPRILASGAEVDSDANGVSIGSLGKSEFDVINFAGATGTIESAAEGRRVNIRTGGGVLDCLADIIVSPCWADEVAAGRGTEGQLATTFSGCDVYLVSTVQYAWDGVGEMLVANGGPGGAKDRNLHTVVFICPGDAGPLSITGDNGNNAYSVKFEGMGDDSQINHGTGGATAVSITGGIKPLTFTRLMMGNVANTAPIVATDGGSIRLNDVTVGLSTGRSPVFSDPTGQSVFAFNCRFPVNQASMYSLDMNSNGNDSTFTACNFDDRVRVGNETKFKTCRFNQGNAAVGVVATNNTVWLQGCEFRTSGSPFTSYITADIGSQNIYVADCFATVGATQAILLTALANGATHHHIVNNNWACALGLNYTGSSEAERINYSGNTHLSTEPGYVPFIYAQGKFKNCTFDANGPAQAYVSQSATSSGNAINGVQTNAGAPSHNSSEGMLYFDQTANTLYINTSALVGNTWAVYGVSGGGAAAPADAQYLTLATNATLTSERVWTPGSGLQGTDAGAGSTYTVALGNLTAGWTQAGVFDISHAGNLTVLKHVAAGSSGIVSANTILSFDETITDPSNEIAGVLGVITKAITGANSQAAIGLSGAVAVTGAFADTGIKTGVKSQLQRLTNTGTSADFRNFWGSSVVNAGTTVTDRYGLYISNATGSGTLTNQYGLYIENMAKGGTLNRAIQSLGGISTILGATRFGSNTVPTNTTDGDITGTRLIVPNATLVHSAVSQLGGPVVIPTGGVIRFSDADDSNYVGLRSPAVAPAANLVIHLPDDTPSAGQVLACKAISSPDVTTEWIAAGGAAASVSMSQVWALSIGA